MRKTSPPNYRAPALEKGLDILEALAAARVPQSLSEMARILKRSASELFRMLNLLERRGYILRDAVSGKYRLSLKLYELAHVHSPVREMLQASLRPMQQLAETLRESCHISVLSGGGVMVIAQAESPEKVRMSVEVGAKFPPLHTVSGRMLLSHLDPEDLERTLADDPEYRSAGRVRRRAIHQRLVQIRAQGYATAENETFIGVFDVAVLAGNPHIGLMAALAAPLWERPGRKPATRKFVQCLKDCARTITLNLGLTPP